MPSPSISEPDQFPPELLPESGVETGASVSWGIQSSGGISPSSVTGSSSCGFLRLDGGLGGFRLGVLVGFGVGDGVGVGSTFGRASGGNTAHPGLLILDAGGGQLVLGLEGDQGFWVAVPKYPLRFSPFSP